MIGRIAARRAGVPLIYHIHSPASRDSTRRVMNRVNQLVERFGAAAAERLIAVSHSLAGHLRSLGYPDERIEVVHNGVPAVEMGGWGDGGMGSKEPWALGTVALFRPRKGTEVLLEAMALLRGEGLPVRLVAIGPFESEDYQRALQTRAKELEVEEHVEWTGFTRDVNAELARCDLLVLPSLFGEGLPMVVLEAMAAGVPVVATEVEGVPEAVRDGIDGVLAPPGDPAALAGAIRRITSRELDWQALSDSARARHRESFSDRTMAAGVARVYSDVLCSSYRFQRRIQTS